jgi:hypothetical protein
MATRLGERRRTRASFTKVLQRLCTRLDAGAVHGVNWYDRFLGPGHARLRARALWVVGSYARGVAHCGDLDVVVDAALEEGIWPRVTRISRALFGNTPDVRVYLGIPEKNSSGVSFPEARLVWSENDKNWSAAIGAIKLDPAAERYARPTDAIPLRAEQFVTSTNPEEFVELRAQQVLAWSFIPIDRSLNVVTLQPDEVRLREYIERFSGAKTRQLAPLIMSHLRDHDPSGTWRYSFHGDSQFRRGGADVVVGRTELRLSRLDDLECSEVIVVPHISKRGPNGLWIIGRGERHPLELAFGDRFAYYLEEGGRPDVILECDDWREAILIELFASRRTASALARSMREAFQVDCTVERAVGHDLLNLIARADTVELDGERFAISEGDLERGPLVSPDELRKALPRTTESNGG